MPQKAASVPSKTWIFVTTTVIAVVLIGSWLTVTSCGSRNDLLNFYDINNKKDESCLLELSDGRWELATNGYVIGANMSLQNIGVDVPEITDLFLQMFTTKTWYFKFMQQHSYRISKGMGLEQVGYSCKLYP